MIGISACFLRSCEIWLDVIKSVLVPLGAESDPAWAISFAKDHDSRLTAIGVTDVHRIAHPEAVPIGALEFKKHRDAVLLAQQHQRVHDVLENFRAACQRAGLPHETLDVEGEPYRQIELAATAHDLIILDRHVSFRLHPQKHLSHTVARVLRDCPRPVLIPNGNAAAWKKAVVAYDGSIPSARTLQLFALLGFAKGLELHVVRIDEEIPGNGLSSMRNAAEFLANHGYSSKTEVVTGNRHTVKALLKVVTADQAGILVMGAYGHSGLRESLLGSTTRHLVEECPTTLFTYH